LKLLLLLEFVFWCFPVPPRRCDHPYLQGLTERIRMQTEAGNLIPRQFLALEESLSDL
jgi:hypothetical protein